MEEFYCSCLEGQWQCAQVAFGCMGPCPPAINGAKCEVGSVVEEGTFECCGSTLPEWVCKCGSAGTYECVLENPPYMMCSCAAPVPLIEPKPPVAEPATSCPLEPPPSGAKCGEGIGLECKYKG